MEAARALQATTKEQGLLRFIYGEDQDGAGRKVSRAKNQV